MLASSLHTHSRKRARLLAAAFVLVTGCKRTEAPKEPAPPASAAPAPAPAPPPPAPRHKFEALCAPPKRPLPDDPAGVWLRGPHSKLCAALTEEASHDTSHGKTLLLFQGDGPDGLQNQHEHEGRYRIFGHSAAAHAFVVGPALETGAAVFIEAVGLVDDRDGTLRWSTYRAMKMVSGVLSPQGQSLAMIALPDRSVDEYELWLYRIVSDQLFRLGPAPAPAPSDWDCERAAPIHWLDMQNNEGYAPLEPGIIEFTTETQLTASYGRDTCKARAKQRKKHIWNLTALKRPWKAPTAGNE